MGPIAVAVIGGFVALAVYLSARFRQAEAEKRQLAITKRTPADITQRYRSLFGYNPNAVFAPT